MVSVESVVFQEQDFDKAVFEIDGSDMDKVFSLHPILPNPTIIAPNRKMGSIWLCLSVKSQLERSILSEKI